MTTLKNLAVAAVSLVVFSSITNAQTLKANYSVKANEPFKVNYVGDEGGYLVFEVTLDNAKSTSAIFAIYDKNEGELYSSLFGNKANVKTIKIEKTNNDQVLDFKMILGKKAFSKSFAANTSLVETIKVTENSVTKL
jgi:hypothetical protein